MDIPLLISQLLAEPSAAELANRVREFLPVDFQAVRYGATSAAIAALPETALGPDFKCTICHCKGSANPGIMLPCGHKFDK